MIAGLPVNQVFSLLSSYLRNPLQSCIDHKMDCKMRHFGNIGIRYCIWRNGSVFYQFQQQELSMPGTENTQWSWLEGIWKEMEGSTSSHSPYANPLNSLILDTVVTTNLDNFKSKLSKLMDSYGQLLIFIILFLGCLIKIKCR